MGSDKGVLARAIAGGFKGGTAALRQTDVLTEKFLWGDEIARQKRIENLQRFGQQKELAGIEAGYREELVTHTGEEGKRLARETRGEIRGEKITEIKDRLSDIITDPKQLFIAKNMADKGFSESEIVGTPAKKVTPAQEKTYYEIAQLMIDSGAKGSLNDIANAFITDHNRRVVGQLDIREQRQGRIDRQTKEGGRVGSAVENISNEITTDKVSGINSLRQLSQNTPNLYKQILANLITQGIITSGDVAEIEKAPGEAGAPVLPPSASVARGVGTKLGGIGGSLWDELMQAGGTLKRGAGAVLAPVGEFGRGVLAGAKQ